MPFASLLAPFLEVQGRPRPEISQSPVLQDHDSVNEEAASLLKKMKNQARTLAARSKRWRNQMTAKLAKQMSLDSSVPQSDVAQNILLETARFLTPEGQRLSNETLGRHRRPQSRALWSYLCQAYIFHSFAFETHVATAVWIRCVNSFAHSLNLQMIPMMHCVSESCHASC